METGVTTEMKWDRRRLGQFVVVVFLLLVGAACGNPTGEPALSATRAITPGVEAVTVDLPQVTPSPPGDVTPQEMPQPGVPDPRADMVNQVKMDLAERLGIDISAIEEVHVQEVQWSDSALGCPAPGQAYAQVITPGLRITLEAEGQTYEYHTDMSEAFVLCGEDGQPVAADRS